MRLPRRAFDLAFNTPNGRLLNQEDAVGLAREYAAAEVARVCEEIVRDFESRGPRWDVAIDVVRSFAHPPTPKTREQALEDVARVTASIPCQYSERYKDLAASDCRCFSCAARRALAYRPEAADAP